MGQSLSLPSKRSRYNTCSPTTISDVGHQPRVGLRLVRGQGRHVRPTHPDHPRATTGAPSRQQVGILPNGQDQLVYSWFQASVQKQNIANAKIARRVLAVVRTHVHQGHLGPLQPRTQPFLQPSQSGSTRSTVNFTPPGSFNTSYDATQNQDCSHRALQFSAACLSIQLVNRFLRWGAYRCHDCLFFGSHLWRRPRGYQRSASFGFEMKPRRPCGQELSRRAVLQGDFTNSTLPAIVGNDTATIIDAVTTGAVDTTHITLFTLEILNIIEEGTALFAAIPVIDVVLTILEVAVTTAVAIYNLVENAQGSPDSKLLSARLRTTHRPRPRNLSPGGASALFSKLSPNHAARGPNHLPGQRAYVSFTTLHAPHRFRPIPASMSSPTGLHRIAATTAMPPRSNPLRTSDHTYLSRNGWFVTQRCTGPRLQGCGPHLPVVVVVLYRPVRRPLDGSAHSGTVLATRRSNLTPT